MYTFLPFFKKIFVLFIKISTNIHVCFSWVYPLPCPNYTVKRKPPSSHPPNSNHIQVYVVDFSASFSPNSFHSSDMQHLYFIEPPIQAILLPITIINSPCFWLRIGPRAMYRVKVILGHGQPCSLALFRGPLHHPKQEITLNCPDLSSDTVHWC